MTRRTTAAPYVMTDNPADPCAYCVSWTDTATADAGDSLPIWPDGTIAPRIYRFIHRQCRRAVERYVDQGLTGMRQ